MATNTGHLNISRIRDTRGGREDRLIVQGRGLKSKTFRLDQEAEAIAYRDGIEHLDFPTPQFDSIEQWLGRIIPDNNDLGQRATHVRRRSFKTRGLQRKEMTETGLRGVDKHLHPFEFKHSLVSRDEIAAKFGKLFLAKLILGKTMPIVWNVNPDERPDFRPLQRVMARVGMSLLTVDEFKATL